LVGQHVVDRPLEDRVAELPRDVDELVEHVARQSLESAVDTGHASGGVLGPGAPPENRGLRELTDVTAQVLEQANVDVQVPDSSQTWRALSFANSRGGSG